MGKERVGFGKDGRDNGWKVGKRGKGLVERGELLMCPPDMSQSLMNSF